MMNKINRIIRHSLIIKNALNHHDDKNPLHMIFDLTRWTLMNRGYIENFFMLGLDQKSRKISDYLNNRSFKPIYHQLYPRHYLCLLEDKSIWEKFINNFPEYAPKNIGYLTKYHFYLPDATPQPIENILKTPLQCIVKNTWGYAGKGVFMLKTDSGKIYINSQESTLDDLKNRIPERAILQQIVEQHETLANLHPASLNTSRIITVNTGLRQEVISTFLRIGVNGNIVDNLAQGNIYIPVDPKTGKLTKMGYSHRDPLFHFSHPQTNIVFDGYQLPFFNEAMEVCKKLHRQLPYFFILGWDVAFTPAGPVIIETNNIHRVVHEQVASGGLKKQFDEYIKEFMETKRRERKPDYA